MEALSLSTLTAAISEILDANFESVLLVKAEIASVQNSSQGHIYFDFIEKNEDNIIAKMRGNMWRSLAYENLINFKNVNGREMQSGDELMMHVHISYSSVYGLSLNVQKIEAEYTLGQREAQKRLLLKKIESEGLINKNKTFTLTPIITRIAVISSNTAAGYQDFITHLKNNNYNYCFETTLFPSLMQGENAHDSIEKAFQKIDHYKHLFDVVILTRGGGAQLDLDCFSTYEVCKSIANCSLPVITGLGHERDVSLSDECAHTFVKTPTAVADFLIQHNLRAENELLITFESIKDSWKAQLSKKRLDLKNVLVNIKNIIQTSHQSEKRDLQLISNQISKFSLTYFLNKKTEIQQHKTNIQNKVSNILFFKKTQLNTLTQNLITSIKQIKEKQTMFLDNSQTQIDLVNPEKVLERGFTYISKQSKIIKKGSHLKKGEAVTIHFKDTEKDATIQ